MGLLFVSALLAPFAIVGLFAKRILRAALSLPAFGVKAAALLYGAVFCLALLLCLAPYAAAEWVFDRYGMSDESPR